jgi:EAL domain-containing protein (putative c-di-GMP-specific phosphodiesterase class I)
MELFYQPIVELATGTMVGLEAQTRWRRPGGEVLSPEVFLPIAEESGLAVHLGNWALAEVCRQGSAWNRARSAHGQKADRLNLTINVSAQQMADPGFIEAFLAILRDTDFPPGQLWLEVTEGAVLEHRELVRDTAEHIRELGVHIGIDAFGSEHASFYYLKELRTELAKLDLRRIGRSDPEVEEGMLRGMLALADALGILCVATGVESARQATLLRSLGYRLAEGVQFGRALSTRQIGAFPTDDLLAWEKAAELTAV